MARSTGDNTKKRRSKQIGTLIGVRLQPDALALLDAWIAEQSPRKLTRPEAIRRLIERGLAAEAGQEPPGGKAP